MATTPKSWADIHARKYTYLNDAGTASKVDKYDPNLKQMGDACGKVGADRLQSLRDTLVAELNALATSACDVPCDEDKELDELMEKYKTHAAKAASGAKTGCATFDNDQTIQLLKAKKEQLKSFSFAYLHGECEAAHLCNPHTDVIDEKLIACSGLLDGGVLFHDDSLADIGRQIGGRQARTLSPAANGFAASLFQTDTIAPGLNQSDGEPTYWVNVCSPALPDQGVQMGARHVHVKWVPANPLEVAKFQTLRHLDVTIRKHKERILQVNHQMFSLRRRLGDARARSAQAYFTRPLRKASGQDVDMEMFVNETAGRLKNKLHARHSEVPAFVAPAGLGARRAAAAKSASEDREAQEEEEEEDEKEARAQADQAAKAAVARPKNSKSTRPRAS